MDNKFYIGSVFIVLIICMSPISTSAQLVDMGKPKSWSGKIVAKSNDQVVYMPGFDMKRVQAEDAVNDVDKTKPWRFGYNYPVDLDLSTAGEWTELPSGDRIWRLTIHSRDAKSINVIFDEFYLPVGAFIHMYNQDKSHLVGAYTHLLNNPDQTLGTELVIGDQVTIEYFEPASVAGQGRLHINTVTHGYRSLHLLAESMMKGLNDSGACNIDVFCPLGDGWDNQIKSVGLIIVNGNTGCSGALINNTAGDARPLFLTANHCLGNPANWVFRFNWNSLNPSCATNTPSGDGPFLQTAFTSTLRASNGGSDFALVELNNPIPTDWDVYFAGWDRSDIMPDFTVGIHHPAGDIKKICRDDDVPSYDVYGGAQVWWISEWEHGVTEPGSSGSPLFDQNKRIIGQLFGGTAACSFSNPTVNNGEFDAYGRMATSWSGSSANNRLSDWLDPLNTGALVLDGLSNSSSGFDTDVALFNLGISDSRICENPLVLNPTIRNLGANTVTSLTIAVRSGSDVLLEYGWSGEILPASNITIELPPISLGQGITDLTMDLLNPNGVNDEDPVNNSLNTMVELIESPVEVLLTLKTDCWGSETTFGIYDNTGAEVAAGGPFSDVNGGEEFQFEFCLSAGCYTFTIFDSYGDGINGSTYPSCNVDGDFSMIDAQGNLLFEMSAPNGSFEDEESHEFCLEAAGLQADFAADNQSICPGGTVAFTDLSTGNITGRWWEFLGGTPAVSTEQNPVVTYLESGLYTVILTVSDGTSTSRIELVEYITVNPPLSPSIEIIENFSCNDDCIGGLQVSIPDGNSPFNILWSTGDTTDTISGLCFNENFSVEVSDASGCIGRDTITLNANGDLNISITTNYECDTQTACAELIINGGTEPYDISWSHLGADQEVTVACGLTEGIYSVSVSDNTGCESSMEFQIDPLIPIELNEEILNENCLGACDGAILLQASGVGPFQYVWSDGVINESSRIDLCPGNYAVTIIDDIGCSEIFQFVILPGTDIVYNLEVDATNCLEESACASVIIDGNTSLYTINWSHNNETSETVCGLNPGTYSVLITHQDGCEVSEEFEVIRLNEPEIFASVSEELCKDDCSGRIEIDLIGQEPFFIEWSTGESEVTNLVNLCAGTYTVTVTDVIDCQSVMEIVLASGPDSPTADFEASNTTVSLMDNPDIVFTNQSDGATSYFWDFGDGTTSEEVSPTHTFKDEGTYTVILTAVNGTCTDIDSLDIMVFLSVSTKEVALESDITVFPNPADKEVFVEFPFVIAEGSAQLLTMEGIVIRDILLDQTSKASILLGHLPTGMYLIRVMTESMAVTKRLQVIR